MTRDELEQLLSSPAEGEHLEFKEARGSFSRDKLHDYCCALYNEGGGHLILGVTDRHPRQVVGTSAFDGSLHTLKHDLLQTLKIRVDAEALAHPDGRVLVFTAPPRQQGHAMSCRGRYLMRSGESLVDMTEGHHKRILAELSPDFSAGVCAHATLSDLDAAALSRFRADWQRRRPQAPLPGSDA